MNRLYLDYIHHKKATKNSRKLNEIDRRRHQTKTQTNGCLFSLVIKHEKKLDWTIRSKNLHHNHALNPDSFQYYQHEIRKPNHTAAIALTSIYRDILFYKDSAAVLDQEGLKLKGKKY